MNCIDALQFELNVSQQLTCSLMQITKEDVANEKFKTILLKKNIRNLGEIQIEYFSVMSYKCPITMKPPTTRQ